MIERDEVFRIKTHRQPGTLARALARIGELGAHIGEIETLFIGREYNIREVTVIAPNDEAVDHIRDALTSEPGIELVEQSVDKVFAVHEGGKIEVRSRVEIRNLQDVREVYTPGVARVSRAIAADRSLANRYTWKGRTVAVVSNGSRVLGLGDIGPEAALPVMEGKALFYGMFVGLNAVPIVIDATTPDEIVEVVRRIAPGFGGIHLEDIATPGAYEVEDRLIELLDIPVMHDDQHGTAVVVMAAVLSAARIVGRPIEELVFGQIGLGAAGSAIARLARSFAFRSVMAFDPGRPAVDHLVAVAIEGETPLEVSNEQSFFDEIVDTADVLVLSTGRPGLLSPDRVRPGQIVAAISNPVPEITMEDALGAGAAVAADGSIVNNVLAYPGLFRGAIDSGAGSISLDMRRAAAQALASMAATDRLLPDPLDPAVHAEVARSVAAAAG